MVRRNVRQNDFAAGTSYLITLLLSASFTGILFLVISLFIPGVWTYYVPALLSVTVLLVQLQDARNKTFAKQIIARHPDSLLEVEQQMLLRSPSLFVPHLRLITLIAKADLGSAATIVLFICAISALVFLFFTEWLACAICAFILFYLWQSKITSAFLTNDPQKDAQRAAWRLDGYTVPEDHLDYLCTVYADLITKLENLLKGT